MIYEDLLGIQFEQNKTDCKWLCEEIYKRLGKKVPDWEGIIEEWNDEMLGKEVDKHRHKFHKLDKPEPYCIVSFFIRPYITTHIGIILEDCKKFIHILKQSGVTVEKLNRPEWEKRITGYWKYE